MKCKTLLILSDSIKVFSTFYTFQMQKMLSINRFIQMFSVKKEATFFLKSKQNFPLEEMVHSQQVES